MNSLANTSFILEFVANSAPWELGSYAVKVLSGDDEMRELAIGYYDISSL